MAPRRSRVALDELERLSAETGRTVDELAAAIAAAGDSLTAGLLGLGEDLEALFGPSGRPPARVARSFGYSRSYSRRVQRGRARGAASARAAAGHTGPPPPAVMSAMFVGVGFAEVHEPTISERRRIARWNARAAELRQGQIAPERFRRLVSNWAPLGDLRFEWTPDVVLATLAERQERGEATFIYRGRRRS